VDAANVLRGERNGLVVGGGIEAEEPVPYARDALDAVPVMGFHYERTDDIVRARAEPPAGDDPHARAGGIEKYLSARSGLLETGRIFLYQRFAVAEYHVIKDLLGVGDEGEIGRRGLGQKR